MLRYVRAALAYAVTSFAAAWILGALRELGLAPLVGPKAALVIEFPLFVAAMVLLCRWSLRRFAVPPALSGRLALGVGALVPVLAAEAAGMMAMRGFTIRQFLESFASVPGLLTLLLFVLFALLPAAFGLAERSRSANCPTHSSSRPKR